MFGLTYWTLVYGLTILSNQNKRFHLLRCKEIHLFTSGMAESDTAGPLPDKSDILAVTAYFNSINAHKLQFVACFLKMLELINWCSHFYSSNEIYLMVTGQLLSVISYLCQLLPIFGQLLPPLVNSYLFWSTRTYFG